MNGKILLIGSVYNSSEFRNFKVLSEIGEWIKNSRQNLEFVIYTDEIDTLLSDQKCNEFYQSGIISIYSFKNIENLNNLFQKSINEHNAAQVIFLDLEENLSVKNLKNFFSKCINQKDTDKIKIGKPDKSSGLKNKTLKLFQQLFTPVKEDGVFNGYISFPAAYLKDILNNFYVNKKKVSFLLPQLLYYSKLQSYKFQSIIYKTKDTIKISAGFASHFLNLLILAFTIRFEWFFNKPVRDIKEYKYEIKFSNSHHSVYRLAFFCLFIVMLIGMPLLSFDFGNTWDESDNVRMANDIIDYFVSLGEDRECFNKDNYLYEQLIHYGLFFDTFTVFIDRYFSPFNLYETRHIFNAFFGLLAMIYAGLVARQIGSWRTGVLALTFILLSPYFFGHSMNNPKDIPLATGYIIGIFYMIRYLKQLPYPGTSTIIYLSLGIALMISIRVAGLILICYTGLFTGLVWLSQTYKYKIKQTKNYIIPYAKYVLGISILSYFLGILPWPYGLEAPFTNPFKALEWFSQFQGVTSYELWEGERINMQNIPWYYVPKFIAITSPLFVIAGFIAAIFGIRWIKRNFNLPVFLLILFSFAFPYFYAVYKDTMVFNGWRHFLFIYPSVVVIAAVGWDLLFKIANIKYLKKALFFLLIGLIGIPVVWSIKYHPNEYNYFNQLTGGYDGAYGNYETATYANCMRQGIEWLIKNKPEVKKRKTIVGVNNKTNTAQFWADQLTDSVNCKWVEFNERGKKNWDYAIFSTRTRSRDQLLSGVYPPKGSFYVKRIEGKPLFAVVKREDSNKYRAFKYMKKGSYEKAIQYLKKAVDYNKMDSEAYRYLGQSYLKINKYKKAKKYLNKCISLNSKDYWAHDYLGMVYFSLQKKQKSIQQFEKAINYKTNYALPYFHKGYAYLKMNKPEIAVKPLKKAVRLTRGKNTGIMGHLASAFLQSGQNRKAINVYKQILNKKSGSPRIYYQIAKAYKRMGYSKKAKKIQEKAKNLANK